MIDYIEFSAKIKEKYPEYKDVDDLVLAQKIVEKYPEYKEKVTFEGVNNAPEKQQNEKKKGIDLTPSGLVDKAVNTVSASVETPFRMAKDNQTLREAFKSGYEQSEANQQKIKEEMPIISGSQNFLTDMAGYSALPVLRGGGIGNFLGNAAIQGGVTGALESLKREGNPIQGAGTGTSIAAVLQTIPKIPLKVV